MKIVKEVTIHDIKVLTEKRQEAKEQAKRFMLNGDLNRYFQKLVEVNALQDELYTYEYELDTRVYELAA